MRVRHHPFEEHLTHDESRFGGTLFYGCAHEYLMLRRYYFRMDDELWAFMAIFFVAAILYGIVHIV